MASMIKADTSRVAAAALGSIAIGILVLAIKYVAYLLTDSVALLSDALESIINVVTAIAAFLAIRLSAKPADRNHPYGHHKAEYLSVILEGVCIVLAALSILRASYMAFLSPHPIEAPALGLAVSGIGTAINAGWGLLLIRMGRQNRSPALQADGKHLFVDVYSSLGVVVGVVLVVLTGQLLLDPLVAALVALSILWSGWGLLKESVAGLMDEAVSDTCVDQIRAVLAANQDDIIEVHDLKTRAAGSVVFIEFHLVLPGQMSVAASHVICDRLERALRQAVEGALITIHVEPEHKAKQTGDILIG